MYARVTRVAHARAYSARFTEISSARTIYSKSRHFLISLKAFYREAEAFSFTIFCEFQPIITADEKRNCSSRAE